MRVTNTNLRTSLNLGVLLVVLTLGVAPLALAADPVIYVDTGGPYSGKVGEPIEFDASRSFLGDGSEIRTYYWDWNMDGHLWGSSTAKCEHTWQCAYSGPVRLYIFDIDGHVNRAEAYVNVSGPETSLCVSLSATADLHLSVTRRRHVGMNYRMNGPEIQIPAASYGITNTDGHPVSPYACDPDESLCQQVRLPLYDGGPYQVKLVGVTDGTVELCVSGYQDGACVAQDSFKGTIFAGEVVTLDLTACCKEGCLSVNCTALQYHPGIKTSPEKIALSVDPGTTVETTLTISETTGLRPLRSVTLRCGDLKSAAHTIKGGDVTFDLNGFDVEPGGKQQVSISIPVPQHFVGQATGSIRVECLDGVSKTVEVVVKKKGFHAPICEPGGPYKGTVGIPVTFDGRWSYDPDGTIVEYAWDWDWTGQFETSSQPTAQHTWDAPFQGTVLLRVTDNEGYSAQKAVSVTVEPEE